MAGQKLYNKALAFQCKTNQHDCIKVNQATYLPRNPKENSEKFT